MRRATSLRRWSPLLAQLGDALLELRDPRVLRGTIDGRGLPSLGSIVVDDAGVHTAATVLRALLAAGRVEQEASRPSA